MRSIDQPPPPMPWYHKLWLAAIFLVTLAFGTATAGSFLHGVISTTSLFAIMALVALYQMRSRKERFLERAAKVPPWSEPVSDDHIREVSP